MLKTTLISLIIGSFFLLFTLALAQETAPYSPTPTPVEYTLPYPGLLPDHPLYFIKHWRDAILSFLISDPIKKIEFQQLLAEKDLNASIYLAQQHKTDLTVTTLTQGIANLKKTENYIFAVSASRENKMNNVKDRFEKLVSKYNQVIGTFALDFGNQKQIEFHAFQSQINTLSQDFKSKK